MMNSLDQLNQLWIRFSCLIAFNFFIGRLVVHPFHHPTPSYHQAEQPV
jgi:hypothetical protein